MNNELKQNMAALALYLDSCADEVRESISNNDEQSLSRSVAAASQALNLAKEATTHLAPKSDFQQTMEDQVKADTQLISKE